MNDDTDSLHWDPTGERLVALCSNAHLGVDRQDEIDYWYRLGQRNAYACAAGVVIARGVDSEAFSVAERLTGALIDGVVDLAPLRSVVLDPTHRTAGVEAGLAWMGPAAFHAQLPPAGADHDFGMRWGANGDQRLSLRLPTGRDHGLLYAYDPTWDEYAVLCRNASTAAVEAAFARALGPPPVVNQSGSSASPRLKVVGHRGLHGGRLRNPCKRPFASVRNLGCLSTGRA